jgi:hypothetical protein
MTPLAMLLLPAEAWCGVLMSDATPMGLLLSGPGAVEAKGRLLVTDLSACLPLTDMAVPGLWKPAALKSAHGAEYGLMRRRALLKVFPGCDQQIGAT